MERKQPKAAQAIALIGLSYVFGSFVAALAGRFGAPEERMLIPSLIAASFGLPLLQRELISCRSLLASGRHAALAAISLGMLGAGSALAGAFGSAYEKQDFLLDTFTWFEAAHSVLLAPLAEEILFTGVLYTVLRARHGLLFATMAVATVFTVAHFPASASSFAVRFAHAVCSCLLLERYRCLPLNILMHSLANAVPVALTGTPEMLVALRPVLKELSYVLGTISVVGTLAAALWLFSGLKGAPGILWKPASAGPAS